MHFGINDRIRGNKTTYTIIKCIDNGSQGYIYQVKGDDDQIYALKRVFLMKQGEISFLKSYFNNQLSFQSILIHYEYFNLDHDIIIIQEFCSGGNLYQLMQKQKLKSQEIQSIFIDICTQLQILREQNYYHRDLKPENILIKRDPKTGRQSYKICDFGEIKQIDPQKVFMQDKNHFNTINVGTPYYQAPEVISSQIYDDSADIWSLGTLLYELYTGETLFNGSSIKEIQLKIISFQQNGEEVYRRIDQLQIEAQFKSLIKNMLSFNPQERPSLKQIQEAFQIQQSINVGIKNNTEQLIVQNYSNQFSLKNVNQTNKQQQIQNPNFGQQNSIQFLPIYPKGIQEKKIKDQIQGIHQTENQEFVNFQQNQISDQIQPVQQINSTQSELNNNFCYNPQIQKSFKEKNIYSFNNVQGQFQQNYNQFIYKPLNQDAFQLLENPKFPQNQMNFQQNQYQVSQKQESMNINQSEQLNQCEFQQQKDQTLLVNQEFIKEQQGSVQKLEQVQIKQFDSTNDLITTAGSYRFSYFKDNSLEQNLQYKSQEIIESTIDIEKNQKCQSIDQQYQQQQQQQQQQQINLCQENQEQLSQIEKINQKIKLKFNIPKDIIMLKNIEETKDEQYIKRIRDYLQLQYQNIKKMKDQDTSQYDAQIDLLRTKF